MASKIGLQREANLTKSVKCKNFELKRQNLTVYLALCQSPLLAE